MNTTEQTFAVACPGCGLGLRVAMTDLGKRRDCPECHKSFKLPSREVAEEVLAKRNRAREEFGFACQLCGSRLYARRTQIGHPMKCPDCHATNHIPEPAVKKQKKAPVELEAYDLLDDDEWSAKQGREPEQFGFPCRVCKTMIYATAAVVGRPTACPDCTAVVIVPKPPRKVDKPKPKLDDGGIMVSPAAPRPKQRRVSADKLVGDAAAKLAEKEAEKPNPPKYPFLSGVFTFPFYPKSLPFALIFAFMASLVAILFQFTLDLTGLSAIIGIFAMAIAGVIGIVLMAMSANYFMRVVNWTAMGYPNIGISPDFEFFEFVRQGLFIINAFGVATFPGFVVGLVTKNWLLAYLVSMGSAYFLFPFFLLSFLDAENPMLPYSGFVASTLRKQPGAWLKFYLLSTIPLVIVVGAHAVSIMNAQDTLPEALDEMLEATVWEYVSIFVTVIGAMIYFRLIGRLAYVIEQAVVAEIRAERKAAKAAG